MQMDWTISLGNVFTIFAMVGSIFWSLVKFRDQINKKADRSDVSRIKDSLQLLSNKIDVMTEKAETTNKKLDELKKEIKESEKQYNELHKDFIKLQTEHDKFHELRRTGL